MKDLIIEQIRKAKDEAVRWANHEIKAIVVKYQGREDKKQLLEAELLKSKEFQDSAVGNGFINSLAPNFKNEEELISIIADYYASSKVVVNPNPHIGWTEDGIKKYVYEDSLIFLRRYYLAKYISELISPPIPATLLELFGNEKQARNFLGKLNSKSKAKDVVKWFREFSPYKMPSDIGLTTKNLYDYISPNYYCQGERTLRDKFKK